MKKHFKKKNKASFIKSILLFPITILKKILSMGLKTPPSYEGTVDFIAIHSIVVKTKNNSNISIEKKHSLYPSVGDIVMVETNGQFNKFGEQCGKITKILHRENEYFIGTIKKDNKTIYLDVIDKKTSYPILIKDCNAINANLRAKVRVIKYPTEGHENFLCEIIKIIGPLGDHETEMKTIMSQYKLSEKFSDNILCDAEQMKIDFNHEAIKRRDYRDILTFTIDPTTAKDYDDALSIQELDNGNLEIGVHIADVSFFVKKNTPIDKEAYKRNTSVYMIDRVIPMLPEKLCNDLCSLRQNEDKLTMSLIWELDKDYNICHEWIGETIIKSDKRMTYEEAQDYLTDTNSEYHKPLNCLLNIAKYLKSERIAKGAINFDFENIDFSLDAENNIIVNKSANTNSHILVEEFMLLANKRVAEFAYNIKTKDKHPVFLYRTHDKPEKDKILEFVQQAKKFGVTIDDDIKKYPFTLNKLFDYIKDDPEKSILSMLAVRTMQRARYTTLPQGHYGLAFEHYTHFTSPIRRYVDLIVHRLLKKYLRGEYVFDPYGYEKMCQYANERESLAFFAERESIKFKQVEALQTHIGEKVRGTISSLTDFGIFVELNNSKCDGLIRFADYKDDYLILDRVHNVVYGKYTGNQFEIGNQLDVIIDKCDIEKRLLNLRFY